VHARERRAHEKVQSAAAREAQRAAKRAHREARVRCSRTRDEILRAAHLAIGQNVFVTSPDVAEQALRAQPWIASATVRRRLPNAFEVHVHERRVAAALLLGALYLVSDEGLVFKALANEDPADLPVITGIDRDRFTSDRTFRSSILLEAVALLHDYRSAGLWRESPIQEIHIEPDDGLSLYVGSDATLVRLGQGPYHQKLARLHQVFEELAQRRAEAAYVYLDNVRRPDRATVRLR
jgi:cell division protein FtsQ